MMLTTLFPLLNIWFPIVISRVKYCHKMLKPLIFRNLIFDVLFSAESNACLYLFPELFWVINTISKRLSLFSFERLFFLSQQFSVCTSWFNIVFSILCTSRLPVSTQFRSALLSVNKTILVKPFCWFSSSAHFYSPNHTRTCLF